MDAGRTYTGGQPPSSIRFGGVEVANLCKDRPAQTILGAEQKAWFLERLRESKATWKIWGNTTATLDMRADLHNLPQGMTKPWPGAGFGTSPLGITVPLMSSAVRFMTSYNPTESRASRPSPAIAIVSGRGWRRSRFRRNRCAGWDRVCDRFNFRSGSCRSAGTRLAQRSSSAIALCWTRAGRSCSAADSEFAGSTWSAFVPRILEEWGHHQGASIVESRFVATCFVCRHGRPRLLGSACDQ